jgi:NH3-dependent NAD+ synthetase
MIPSIGVRATVPIYYRRGNTIRDDLVSLVKQFAKRYPDNRYVISLSGGIDSEVTAETFYELGIPFRVLTLKLFEGSNYHDIMWAVKYCRQRNLKQKIINLTIDKMLQETIPEGVEHGQFTHSYSQIALTELFNHIEEDEILINSGHNPDFHTEIGVGWWEDSPDKDNDFLYASFPSLQRREKLTGWEHNSNIIGLLQDRIRSCAAYKHQSFITWETFTLAYMRKVFVQKGLQGKYYE